MSDAINVQLAKIQNAEVIQSQEINGALYRRFLAFLDASPETIRAYSGNLRQFMMWLFVHDIQKPTRETIITYRDELKTKYKATTVQNYIEAVKLFFSWTSQEGLYPNIADRIKGARITREHKKDYLTSTQANAVLTGIDRSTEQGLRDYAIICLAITGGLRVIEAYRANIEDLGKAGNASALYLQGKGRDEKAEFIKIPLEVEIAIRTYLKSRGKPAPKDPLFTSLSRNSKGRRLSRRSISGIIKKHLINAGYESDRLTAHSLRHSAVTIALLEGSTLQEVQQFARHKNISTTQIYAHNLNREHSNCENSIANSIFKKGGNGIR